MRGRKEGERKGSNICSNNHQYDKLITYLGQYNIINAIIIIIQSLLHEHITHRTKSLTESTRSGSAE